MYLQIVDQVKQRVASGDWAPGQEIPSIRGLAADLKVSVITVKRAYAELEQAGIIVTNQGKGSCIADSVPDLGSRMQEEELYRHLRAAAELALALGWSARDIAEALRNVQQQAKQEK
ncbi:MAG: GntR family transcriptional regulator [bacterium]|nr:GntR family transcriptional regulator [bacterium]